MAEEEVLKGVGKTILVLSGKGGVGKSTVAVQLALAHQQAGLKVGILDIDLCGPSVPRMLGLQDSEIHQGSQGWLPVYTDASQTLGVMSIAFLLASQDEAVIWRGPKKNAMIKQFLTDVAWGEMEVLIIDTPPGTSDEHITVMEALKGVKVEGAVLVTTPQAVAVGDVRRELTFCRKTGLKVLGIVENMSGYVCPHCSTCTNVFSSGGGEALATHAKVAFLGRIPLEPQLALAAESGAAFMEEYKDSQAAQSLVAIFQALQGGQAVEQAMEQAVEQAEEQAMEQA